MSNLFGNHIDGFPMRRLKYWLKPLSCALDWLYTRTHVHLILVCNQIVCESGNFEYSECSEPEWRAIYQVTVTQKESGAACDYSAVTVDVSYSGSGIYGYRDNILWVHGGCQATFKVCYYLSTSHYMTQKYNFTNMHKGQILGYI